MTTRARRAPKIRAYRENLPGVLRVTLIRELNGQRFERHVGPRGWLNLEEAATVLQRPPAVVLQSIRAGFLRARGRGRRVLVTLAACERFRSEEAEDGASIRARRHQRRYPAEEVHAELGL